MFLRPPPPPPTHTHTLSVCSPTPSMEWDRLDKPLPPPPRVQVGPFGKEISIANVNFEDAGQYQCRGTNQESSQPVTRDFELIVECEKIWNVVVHWQLSWKTEMPSYEKLQYLTRDCLSYWHDSPSIYNLFKTTGTLIIRPHNLVPKCNFVCYWTCILDYLQYKTMFLLSNGWS